MTCDRKDSFVSQHDPGRNDETQTNVLVHLRPLALSVACRQKLT